MDHDDEQRPAAGRFEALVLPHADAAYNLALRLTRRADVAEDVTHDAFIAALRGLGQFRGGDARAWTLRIVRNRAYDWLRERKLKSAIPLDDPDREEGWDIADTDQESAEQALIRQGEAANVHRLLETLPPRLREVLVLREMEDLSYRQIAEITEAPIGSVMSRLSRARALAGEAWRRLNMEAAT